jgi:hypothetical protein
VEYLSGYTPGAVPLELEPGRAKLVSAGSDIVFELHYTPNGTPATDQTKIGLIFAKERPKERVYTVVLNAYHFAVPPGRFGLPCADGFGIRNRCEAVVLDAQRAFSR